VVHAALPAPSPATTSPAAPLAAPPVQSETPLETVTFDEAVARALSRNPSALEARDEVRRVRAVMEEVRARSLPTLVGLATYTRLEGNRVSATAILPVTPGNAANETVTVPGAIVEPGEQLNLNVTLDVPIVSTRTWLQWTEAGDQIDVARATEADVRRTIAADTVRAYLTVITQRRLLETAQTARDNAKAHYDFTHGQREGGVGTRLDEVRAAQELTTEEANLENQVIALFSAREALGVLVAGNEPIDARDESVPGPVPALDQALSDAVVRRPDVLARQRAARAADRTVRDAWSDYAPYVDLMAFPFYQAPPTTTVPRTGWQASLVLTLPLYDGGLRYGQEHERQALADEAGLAFQGTLRQARSDVRVAFEEMRRGDVALDQAERSAAFARTALELANEAYRAGATSNLEVIDAERQARDAETQAAIAENAARQARLDVLVAAGRFP
jgi:outer membrane protein TolC